MSARLLVVALDSGDPGLMHTLCDQGRMPVLSSIMARGCHGLLTGPELISAHGVWTTLFSGVSLGEHGRYLRKTLQPGSYRLGSAACEQAVTPFWAGLRGSGRRAAIIDAPDAEVIEGIDGVQATAWGTHPTFGRLRVCPSQWTSEITRIAGSRIVTDEKQGSPARDLRIRDQILERIRGKGRLIRHLLSQDAFDLMVVGFGDSHAAAHRFLKYHDAGDGGHPEALSHALRDIYAAIDSELGSLLDVMTEPVNLVVVSNHGVRSASPTWELTDKCLHALGYQARRESSLSAAALSAYPPAAADGTLAFMSRRLPAGLRDRLEDKRFTQTTDWSRSIAFAIPAFYTGYIRINVAGREPSGIVEPGSHYDEVIERLEQDLFACIDEDTSESAVAALHRTRDLFGEAALEKLPDLILDWRQPRLGISRLTHPRTTIVCKHRGNPRHNCHSRVGFLAATGPDISTRGDIGELSPLALAPALEFLCGVSPLGRDAAGHGCEVLLNAA